MEGNKGTVTLVGVPKQQLFVCAVQRQRFDVSLGSVSAVSNLCIPSSDFQVTGSLRKGQVGPGGSPWSDRARGHAGVLGAELGDDFCTRIDLIVWDTDGSRPSLLSLAEGEECSACLLPEAAYLPTHDCSALPLSAEMWNKFLRVSHQIPSTSRIIKAYSAHSWHPGAWAGKHICTSPVNPQLSCFCRTQLLA